MTKKNISDTIKELIEDRKDFEKCNEKMVAAHIGTTEKRFRNCLSGNAEFKASEIIELAEYFGVSTDRILTGNEEKNRTIVKDLGLSDTAIDYLKDIKSREFDYQESFIDKADDYIYDAESAKQSGITVDTPIVEGGTTDEILFIVNWLLSNPSGHALLSMIAKYCLIDSSQAWLYDYGADNDNPFPFTECDEIHFKNRFGEGWKTVNPGILRYALIPAITDKVNKIRDEISKEVIK